jgi:5S rRNA maturation endonuclease (ribonuclease M5)
VNNLVLVEGNDDKEFIEALIRHCNIRNIKCSQFGGISKLSDELEDLTKKSIIQNQIKKIGIIIDLDEDSVAHRLDSIINKEIQEVFATKLSISQMNHWVTVPVDSEVSVEISCYFMNVNGRGELETVLRAIKKNNSVRADCLEKWRECVEATEMKLTNNEFDELWINTYQRFDCCTKTDRNEAKKNCSLTPSLKKGIYDFDSPVLQELKQFLIALTS